MANDSVLLIDPWTLRCFFNGSKYRQRFELNEFTVEISVKKVAKTVPGRPLGVRHSWVVARRNGEDVFQAHRLVDGTTHQPVSELDPKMVAYKGSVYAKDDTQLNPYENKRIRGALYARWRKSTCALLRYQWFWSLTVFCFPGTKNSLEAIRKAFHRVIWIICAHVYRA